MFPTFFMDLTVPYYTGYPKTAGKSRRGRQMERNFAANFRRRESPAGMKEFAGLGRSIKNGGGSHSPFPAAFHILWNRPCREERGPAGPALRQ